MLSKNPPKAEKLKSLGLSDEDGVNKKTLDLLYTNIIYNKSYRGLTITRKEKLRVVGLDETTLISELDDDVLNKMYVKVIMNYISETPSNAHRKDKLKRLGLDTNVTEDELSNDILNQIYNNRVNEKNIGIKKAALYKLAPDHPKYIVTLNFLNKLMKELGRNKITELTEFKGIRKNDLLEEKCIIAFNTSLGEILTVFDRSEILYNKKAVVKTYILTVIKCIVSSCGYSFNSYARSKTTSSSKGISETSHWVEYGIC